MSDNDLRKQVEQTLKQDLSAKDKLRAKSKEVNLRPPVLSSYEYCGAVNLRDSRALRESETTTEGVNFAEDNPQINQKRKQP